MTTSRSAVRLRNAVSNLLRDIGEEHDGWTLEEPPEEMKMDQEQKLQAARSAVIEAAKKWEAQSQSTDPIDSFAGDLRVKVFQLNKLETPADPLEPVREFVGAAYREWETRGGPGTHVYMTIETIKAIEKALGMVKS